MEREGPLWSLMCPRQMSICIAKQSEVKTNITPYMKRQTISAFGIKSDWTFLILGLSSSAFSQSSESWLLQPAYI